MSLPRTIRFLPCAAMLFGAACVVSVSASQIDVLLSVDNRAGSNEGVVYGQALDDLGFLRKATVDMVGRIPTYADIQQFQQWPPAKRRSMLVDRLMDDKSYADRWTVFFADMLRIRSRAEGGELQVETFAELREVERFQLKAAEAFYTKGEFAAAAAEYEKYITLYGSSPGGAYAQLMWSHCQVRQRRVYTAIRDGFRSVIDYWPESHEAKLSAYLIGKSYKSIGEVKKAKAAYGKAIAAHPVDHIAVLSKWDMAEIARIRKDAKRLAQVWSDLVFNTKLNKQNRYYIERAAQGLARHHFAEPDFAKARKVLKVLYSDAALVDAIYQNAKEPVSHLCRDGKTRRSGEQLADRIITLLLDETLDIKPSGNGTDEIREWFRRAARLHERAGRDLDVIKTYEHLAKRIGMDDGVRGSIAAWHRAKKRYPKAREFYAQFEDTLDGLIQIASTWLEEGQPARAIRLYERLAKLEPGTARRLETGHRRDLLILWPTRQGHRGLSGTDHNRPCECQHLVLDHRQHLREKQAPETGNPSLSPIRPLPTGLLPNGRVPPQTQGIHRGADAVSPGLGHGQCRARRHPVHRLHLRGAVQKKRTPSNGFSAPASFTPALATPAGLTPICKNNTASASPSAAQKRNKTDGG
jgi:tetratricopeptide (TPR) repeat protein